MANATQFTCPSGGQWYACGAETSKFVGCCATDPCSKGCSQGSIRPGGFNATDYEKFPDASCESGSNFYTCAAGSTFWGCCKSNPCSNAPASTCKDGDLVPAFLGRPDQFNSYAPSSIPSPSSTPKSGSSSGAVIGGAVGGGVGAAIIIGILIFLCCRRRKHNQQPDQAEAGATASTPMMKQGFEESFPAQHDGQSPPPTYSSPNPNFYQSMSPAKGHSYHHSYQEYNHEAGGPQELPAETTSPAEQRYSELPAEGPQSRSQRISELPVGATHVAAELESPQTSPRPAQRGFPTDMPIEGEQVVGAASDRTPKEKTQVL